MASTSRVTSPSPHAGTFPVLPDLSVDDPKGYEKLPQSSPVSGHFAKTVNSLEIESFIAPKDAILLKNNAHDLPFIIGIARRILNELNDQGIVGASCYHFLNQRLDQKFPEEVFDYLRAIALYKKGAENAFGVDWVPLPILDYSKKVIQLGLPRLKNEIANLQEFLSIQYLKAWLDNTHRNCPGQIHGPLILAIQALHARDQVQFKTHFLAYLEAVQKHQPLSEIEKLSAAELSEALKGRDHGNIFTHLYHLLRTEEFYRNCTARVRELKEHLSGLRPGEIALFAQKCTRAFNGCAHLLADHRNLPCASMTKFALYAGRMRKEWLEINSLFHRATGDPHHFCNCHAENPAKETNTLSWPSISKRLLKDTGSKFREPHRSEIPRTSGGAPLDRETRLNNGNISVAISGCAWGGGHKEAAKATLEYCRGAGFHPFTIDLADDVLLSEDAIHQYVGWINDQWTTGSVYNGLLKEKAYALINFLRSASTPSTPDAEAVKRQLILVLQRLLMINPDILISTYSIHDRPLIAAAKILGIPFLYLCTDADTRVDTHEEAPGYKHFKAGIFFDEQKMKDFMLTEKTATREQIVPVGPIVKREFMDSRNFNEILKLKEKWGFSPDKKVVVISSGSNGAYVPYADRIADKYHGKTFKEIPVHLVVICGEGNDEYITHIKRDIMPNTNMPIRVVDRVSGSDMEELLAMASYGGCVINKAGGITLAETSKHGTRILVDNVHPGLFEGGFIHFVVTIIEWILRLFGFESQSPWEKTNAEFIVNHGLGEVINTLDDFEQKFDRILQHNAPHQMDLPVHNYREKIYELIKNMLKDAARDPHVQQTKATLDTI